MRVVVSGQAGAFAVPKGDRFQLYRPGTEEPVELVAGDLDRLFAGCGDVRRIEVGRIAEAHARLKQAIAADRAVRLFIMLLDSGEPGEDKPDIRDC